MVAQITVKLLLSLFAIRATAQVPTIVARPVDEYKLSEGPTPPGEDIVVEQHDSGTALFLGPDRASNLRSVVDNNCQTMDENCLGSVQKVLGMIPNEDGLHKRIIPLLIVAGAVSVEFFSIIAGMVYFLHEEESYEPVKFMVPKPTETAQEGWATATELVFKPSETAEPTTVAIPRPSVQPVIPLIETVSSGTAITFPPGSLQFWIDSGEQAICRHSLGGRQDTGIDTCLRQRTEYALMAALTGAGIGGLELIHLPRRVQVLKNDQVKRLISSVTSSAESFQTIYSQAEIARLAEIISIFMWDTFSGIASALTEIDIGLDRITLKKEEIEVLDDDGDGCSKELDPQSELPGYDEIVEQIAAAIFKDPDWNSTESDLNPRNDFNAECLEPNGRFPDLSLPQDDVRKIVEDYCTKKADASLRKDPIFEYYKKGIYSLWLVVKIVDGDKCPKDPSLQTELCARYLQDGLDQCTQSGKIFGSEVIKDCVSYSILTDHLQDEDNPPWDRKAEPECGDDLTNVQYNFFRGLYPAFCESAGGDELEKTLTNKDYQTPNSRKRSPPASNTDYEGYKFQFKSPGGGDCRMDCTEAFERISGACGSYRLTSKGTINAGCGTYSYEIEEPPEPEPEPEINPETDCPEVYPGFESVPDMDAFEARNQCKDKCPGGEYDSCRGINNAACTCVNEVCIENARGLCWATS